MRYTKRNIPYHELIGLEVAVKEHSDTSLVGIKGKVVDETKNMLIIRKDNGRGLMIPKFGGKFLFKIPRFRYVLVPGDILIGRPEERLRRLGR